MIPPPGSQYPLSYHGRRAAPVEIVDDELRAEEAQARQMALGRPGVELYPWRPGRVEPARDELTFVALTPLLQTGIVSIARRAQRRSAVDAPLVDDERRAERVAQWQDRPRRSTGLLRRGR